MFSDLYDFGFLAQLFSLYSVEMATRLNTPSFFMLACVEVFSVLQLAPR